MKFYILIFLLCVCLEFVNSEGYYKTDDDIDIVPLIVDPGYYPANLIQYQPLVPKSDFSAPPQINTNQLEVESGYYPVNWTPYEPLAPINDFSAPPEINTNDIKVVPLEVNSANWIFYHPLAPERDFSESPQFRTVDPGYYPTNWIPYDPLVPERDFSAPPQFITGDLISQYPEQDLQSIDVEYSEPKISDGTRNNKNSASLPDYSDFSNNADQLTHLPYYEGQCSTNEIWSECGGNCEQTCANYMGTEPPKMCPLYCSLQGSCKCAPGFYRRSSTNSTCVSADICRQCEGVFPNPNPNCGDSNGDLKICKDTEVWSQCASSGCEATCGTYLGKVPPKMCTMICRTPGNCVCADGYVKRSETNSTCVAETDCAYFYALDNSDSTDCATTPAPVDTELCATNEIWLKCASACQPTCANTIGLKPYKYCTDKCVPNSCVCKTGFVQISEQNRTCVAEDECGDYYTTSGPDAVLSIGTNMSGTEHKDCPENEIWTNCGNKCQEGNCDNYKDTSRICPMYCKTDSCKCADGYIRKSSTNDTCVPIESC